MPPTPDNTASNPTPASNAPGSDVLLDTLRRSKISDTQRQQMWDAYQTPGDEKAFVGALNKLSIQDDAKQDLYNMRFKGWKNPATKGPEAQATPQAPTTSTPQTKQAEPSFLDKAHAAITALFDPAAEQQDRPKAGDYQTRPHGPVLNTGDTSVHSAARVLESGLGIGREPDSFTDAVQQSASSLWKLGLGVAKDPLQAGKAVEAIATDLEGRAKGIYRGVQRNDPRAVGAEVGGVAGTLGQMYGTEKAVVDPLSGEIKPYSKSAATQAATGLEGLTRDNVSRLQTKGYTNQEISMMNATELDAAIKGGPKPTPARPVSNPETSTPMGPRNSANQQLHVQVSANAPIEARAPQAVGSFEGAEGPMRPWDPTGTRFARGGTIGLDAISSSYKPEDIIAPQVRPEEINTDARIADVIGPEMAANGKPKVRQDGGIKPEPTPEEVLAPKFKDRRAAELNAVSANKEQLISAFTTDKERLETSRRSASSQDKLLIDQRLNDIHDNLTSLGAPPVDKAVEKAGPEHPEVALQREGPNGGGAKVLPEGVRKSIALPEQVNQNLDTMTELSRQADLAVTEQQRDALEKQRDNMLATSLGVTRQHLSGLTGEQLLQFRDDALSKADKLDAQGKAIHSLTNETIKNRGINKELTAMRAVGGPVRHVLEAEEGDVPVQTATDVKIYQKPEYQRMAVKQLTKIGPGAAAVIDEARGKAPRRQIGDLELNARPDGVSVEEWDTYVDKELANRKSLVKQISDSISIAHETASPLDAAKIENLSEQLKDLDNRLGKYATLSKQPGRVPNLTPELDEHGAIKAPEQIKSWTLERARLAFGKKIKAMPSDEEFFQEGDRRLEKAKLLRTIADVSDKVLKQRNVLKNLGQRGGIGEIPGSLRGKVAPVSIDSIPSVRDMIQNAVKAKIPVYRINPANDEPLPFRAWIIPSKEGNWVLDVQSINREHDVAAADVLGAPNAPAGVAQIALLKAGAIRKNTATDFELGTSNPSKAQTDVIENSLIRDRATKKEVFLDMPGPRGIRALHIEPGWENLNVAIERAKSRDRGFTLESGKIPGILPMASAALGGAAGAMHGPLGFAVGFAFGFVAPALFMSRPVIASMRVMQPLLHRMQVSLQTWFHGPQQMDAGSETMQQIRREQENHSNRGTRWMERLALLPEQVYKGWDPFAAVADKKNMPFTGKALMAMSKGGRVFRDLSIPDTQSLYLAAWDARGDAYGLRAYQGYLYRNIKIDAMKAGALEAVTQYLNHKGYQRVFQVLSEHENELVQQIQKAKQDMGNPQNSVLQVAQFKSQLAELTKMRKEMNDKIMAGKVVPGKYTPQSLAKDMQDFQQKLGPQRFAQVEALVQRGFTARVPVLDMLLDNGLVSRDAYITFRSRGPEYVPMTRIMDDLANNRVITHTQPLNLKHQTVIQMLEGSERTNVDPWEAFSHVDGKAFNQIIRNQVTGKALQLAEAHPWTIGQEFTPVDANYQAKAGEVIIGHYRDGTPQLYAVPQYLGDVLQRYPLATQSALGVFARAWSETFKTTATTLNIGFQMGSLIFHAGAGLTYSATAASKVGAFVKGWGRAAKSVLREDQEFLEMIRSGAAFGGMQALIDPERMASPSELGWGARIWREPLEASKDFAAALENINRTNVFSLARKAGANVEEAKHEAKRYAGAPDFTRMGDISRPLNLAFMFLTAKLAYLNQMGSALRKDPKRIVGTMVALTAMSLALSFWNTQQVDSDGQSLLRKVPLQERQRNWVVLTPWTRTVPGTGAEKAYQINIPKMTMAEVVNPIDDAANYLAGKEARTGTQVALDSISNFAPLHLQLQEGRLVKTGVQSVVSNLFPGVKAGIEQYSNTDDFGRPIVPTREQGIDPQYQVSIGTSPVFQEMGKGGLEGAQAGTAFGGAIGTMIGGPKAGVVGAAGGAVIGSLGISPRRLQAGSRSLFANAGDTAESYLAPFFGGIKEMKQDPRHYPVAGPVIRRFAGSDMDQEEVTLMNQFSALAQTAKQPLATLQFLEKERPEEVAKYADAHSQELWRGKLVDQLDKRLGQLRGYLNDAQKIPDDKARTDTLGVIHKTMIDVLKIGIQMMREKPSGETGQRGTPTSTALRP